MSLPFKFSCRIEAPEDPEKPESFPDKLKPFLAPFHMFPRLYKQLFKNIEVDKRWLELVRDAEGKGIVVYVLRNLSLSDFFALDYLTKRYRLPQIQFANDATFFPFTPFKKNLTHLKDYWIREQNVQELKKTIERGANGVLFLRHPPEFSLGDQRAQTKPESEFFLRELIHLQSALDKPIIFVPQIFLWTKAQDNLKNTLLDAVFGPREWPGTMRSVAQMLANYRSAKLFAADPLFLPDFLRVSSKNDRGAEHGEPQHNLENLERKLAYTLLTNLERERRAIIGPAKKPADLVRHEILRSPRIQEVISKMAGPSFEGQKKLKERALNILEKMETLQDNAAVGLMDHIYEATLAKMYTDIEVDIEGLERIRHAARRGTLVLLPCHKSHVDYILLTRVFYRADLSPPVIASGDNLDFFPVGPIFRRGGAFFIRRKFLGDRLYIELVDAYVRRLLRERYPIEFFLEGGRSRTGKLLHPKTGLLSMVVDAALTYQDREVYFCPISIGYERIVEEDSHVAELGGKEKNKEGLDSVVRALKQTRGRYGRVNVQFGELLTLQKVMSDEQKGRALSSRERKQLCNKIAHLTMNEINRVTAATPAALLAMAMLTDTREEFYHDDLMSRCEMVAQCLHFAHVRFSPALAPRTVQHLLRREAISESCEMLLRAGHIEVASPVKAKKASPTYEARYRIAYGKRPTLDLSKNSIMHAFSATAIVATAVFSLEKRSSLADAHLGYESTLVKERALDLSRLLKFEFSFRADASFDVIYEQTVHDMLKLGILDQYTKNETSYLRFLPDNRAAETAPFLPQTVSFLYIRSLVNFLQSYWIAAKAVANMGASALTKKELTHAALQLGKKLIADGEAIFPEALSKSCFENAWLSFSSAGYLRTSENKLTLLESYRDEESASLLEKRIAEYL